MLGRATAVLDALGDMGIAVGLDHKITFVNRAAIEQTGYPESELIGATCFQKLFGSFEPCSDCPNSVSLETTEKPKVERQLVSKNGTIIYTLLSTCSVSDDNRVCIIHDITERKKWKRL